MGVHLSKFSGEKKKHGCIFQACRFGESKTWKSKYVCLKFHNLYHLLAYFLPKKCQKNSANVKRDKSPKKTCPTPNFFQPAEPRSSMAMDSSKQHQILRFLWRKKKRLEMKAKKKPFKNQENIEKYEQKLPRSAIWHKQTVPYWRSLESRAMRRHEFFMVIVEFKLRKWS